MKREELTDVDSIADNAAYEAPRLIDVVALRDVVMQSFPSPPPPPGIFDNEEDDDFYKDPFGDRV